MKKWLQKKFISYLVHDLFNMVDEEDILKIQGGHILFHGKPLEPEQVQALAKDASDFQDSVLWKMLRQEVRYQANQRMFEKSNNTEDILAGKLMLYVIDVIDKKLMQLRG